jgi:[pyruvate, water dikinase]-phosphate phosphotransferase / [pyruvate, water dikinase] kinase
VAKEGTQQTVCTFLTVFTLSDSSGETAEMVARAALSQFPEGCVKLYRLPSVKTTEELKETMGEVHRQKGLIAYTLVNSELKVELQHEAARLGIPVIDLLGPFISNVTKLTGINSLSQPGRLHLLDESYFLRINAIDFAIRYDDGKNQEGLEQADVILSGVSRTSKTPNSMYLAQHWGLKTANVPLIYGIEPPASLFSVDQKKIIGLTIDPYMLLKIRRTRASVLGISHNANYTDPAMIEQEVNYARKIFRRLGCHVIDVSNKAIEETSGEIYLYLRR